MKKLIPVLIMLIGLSISTQSKADDTLMHFAAHAGASYAIEMMTYGLAKNAFRMSKTQAVTFSIFTTLTIGLVYKGLEFNQNGWPPDTGRSMLFNAIGTGAAVGSIYVFHF